MEFKRRDLKIYTIKSLTEYINIINMLKNDFVGIYNNDYGFKCMEQIKKFSDRNNKIIAESESNFFEINSIYNDFGLYSDSISYVKGNSKFFADELKQKTMIYYRGLYDESYDLKPSCVRGSAYQKEKYYYDNIKVLCSHYFSGKSHLNDLVTMQHYDAPTRLLDVSSNPLVALFFACKDFTNQNNSSRGKVCVFAESYSRILFSDSDKAVILACLAKFSYNEQKKIYDACIRKIVKDGFFAKFDASNNGRIIEKLYHEIRTERDFEKLMYARDILNSYFIQPQKTNPRIQNQSGAFLLCGLSKDPNEYNKRVEEKVLVTIKIENRDLILQELDRININEAFLFPEIDKVAEYLKSQ